MRNSLVISRRGTSCGSCGRPVQAGLAGLRELSVVCADCLRKLEPWLALLVHLDRGLVRLSASGCADDGFKHVCQEYLGARERVRRERRRR